MDETQTLHSEKSKLTLSATTTEKNVSSYPSVTLAIPTYNEAANIERVIRDFLSTKYPNLIEIFIADGGSSDGTDKIIETLSVEDSRVKLIHNPQKIQSAGLNLILKECNGNIFLRADAHSDYAPDYIEKCVEALLESKALNVGGAQRFVGKTPFQSGVTLASKSILGSGGAKYRDPNYDGYAETVYIGCFWRQALLDVGGFDTTQITNQDAELNQKLLNKSEKAIYISSKIRVWYYPRKTWKSLWIQYFKYGRGRYLTTTKHSNRLQLRGKLPFLAISSTIIMLLIDLLFPNFGLPVIEIILFGVLFVFLESLRINWKFRNTFTSEIWRGNNNELPSFLSRWFFCGVTLLTMPIAHFSGYAYQLFRCKILRVEGW
ncbi:glycosyltransferase family 2 protein [Anabaena azotica]|uniref:glycosyltransferase family 2 protein n=1 Tax=Anabaena azotica TaxID=197653 RepID=UPI0039A4F8D8